MAREKRLGIISIMEGYPWGGSEALWLDMAEEALKKNIHVSVSYKHWDALPQQIKHIEEKGADLYLRKPNYIKTPLVSKVLRKLRGQSTIIKKENPFLDIFAAKPDLLLINEGAFTSILHFPDLYELLLDGTIPYVLLVHQNREYGAINPNLYEKAKTIYSNAKQVLFVSKRNKDMANTMLCTTLKNAIVVRNPVNLETLGVIDYPKSNQIKLATVGRLFCEQKGQDLLLRALAQLKDDYNFTLSIYGTGEDEIYLKELTSYLNLENHVTFAGYNSNVRAIWNENQMLALASHYEGIPLVVVEAMLCGRPCLLTDVAGNTEWIQHLESGFIANSPTVEALVKVLKLAFNQKEKWQAMGEKAASRAEELYDPAPGETILKLVWE
jgi:glycosyltransferase involved in cell wall biosynthesis